MMMIVSVEQRPGWAEHVCGRSLEMLPDVSSVDAKASSSQLSSLCITYLSSDCCSKHSIPWLSCGLQVPTTSTTMKSKKKRLWSCIAERLSAISDIIFFPNSVSFGVFSHSKGSGAGRSSQIRWEPGSLEGSLEEVPFTRESLGARSAWHKVGNRVPRKKFPSKVSQQGSPEPVPKQGFPARGSQAKFLSKVPRNRFPSKGSQQEVPKQGSH